MTPRQLFHAFFDAINARDYDALVRLVHPEFVEEYPQSGERIRGAANLRSMIENYPGGLALANDPEFFGDSDQWVVTPSFLVAHVATAGETGTGVLKVRYPDGSVWWMVALFEVRDGLLFRQQTFFAEPFEPPAWRAPWVEPIAPGS